MIGAVSQRVGFPVADDALRRQAVFPAEQDAVFHRRLQHQMCIRDSLSPADDNRTLVAVDGGPGAAGRTAVVFVGIPQPIPDLASDAFADFYAAMLTPLKKAEADGVMSDEWGYDCLLYTSYR